MEMAKVSIREQITRLVQGALAKRFGRVEVAPDANLTDLGLTSLDMVGLMLAIEDAFGIEIPQRRMTPANFRSVGAIEQLIATVSLAA
jgi:acyl carrier protein